MNTSYFYQKEKGGSLEKGYHYFAEKANINALGLQV
jgi:hypothetical protein